MAYVLWEKQRAKAELEHRRASLIAEWASHSREIASTGESTLRRIERLLADMTNRYDGDYVDAELSRSTLDATLTRTLVYARVSMVSAKTHESLAAAAAQSAKDGFLLCLLSPPRPATERGLLPKVRVALEGGAAVNQLAPNALRLHDAELGMSYFTPSWRERIVRAGELSTISRLERELQKAPLVNARNAVQAELLVAALDEPNDSGGVTEMDGEHPHAVRVGLWDLRQDRLLLRLRRQVDPEWITANRRSMYARELDGCKLALAVHDAARTETTPQ